MTGLATSDDNDKDAMREKKGTLGNQGDRTHQGAQLHRITQTRHRKKAEYQVRDTRTTKTKQEVENRHSD